ncbi:MAG: sodium:calcium antiporter, partial [Chloroflexota bacterium]|nr:sodium:calcium antiporter [Chloroflexota bacterium]
PETLIPIVAVIFGATSGESHANDVGLGAIIGAPFMLSTVAMLVTGVAVFIFAARGRRSTAMRVNSHVLGRDIRFFLGAFSVALLSGFIQSQAVKVAIAIGLVLFYAFYIYKHATAKDEGPPSGEEAEELSPLHFARRNPDPGLPIIVAQIVFGLGLIVGAATLFVQYVSDVATSIGVTPLILSLIVVPLATELPEKFNSVLWVRRGKDTLALGNITGAMVFQSTLPVSFGMVFTEWHVRAAYVPAFLQAALALVAASILFGTMAWQKKLSAQALLAAGIWYLVWIIVVFPVSAQKLVENWGWLK